MVTEKGSGGTLPRAWVAVICVLGASVLGLFAFVFFVRHKEKAGEPVFNPLLAREPRSRSHSVGLAGLRPGGRLASRASVSTATVTV